MNFKFSVVEQLIILAGLRRLIDEDEVHPADKEIAKQVIEKIYKQRKSKIEIEENK